MDLRAIADRVRLARERVDVLVQLTAALGVEDAERGLAAVILPDQRLVVLALALLEVAERLQRVDAGAQGDVGIPG